MVANRTFSSEKPSISPSNVPLNANPGTVLKSDKGPVGHHCIFYIKFYIELNTGCR